MDWIRIALSGKTADGREIDASHLEQMAKNYDTEKYGARIWMEHFRSYFPKSDFQAYGDVIDLKVEKENGKTALYAKIEPTQDLIDLNKSGQKVFTSVEITPDFSDTGEAYLTGLAVTDSPASLGTSRLEFSIGQDVMKNNLGNKILGDYIEFSMDSEKKDEASETAGTVLLNKVKNLFSRKEQATNDELEKFADVTLKIAEQLVNVENRYSGLKTDHTDLKIKFTKLGDDFNALKTQLATTEQPSGFPESTGNDTTVETDC